MKKYLTVLFLLFVFALGVSGGIYWSTHFSACTEKFFFINPDLGCNKKQVLDKSNPIVLKEKLNAYIAARIAAGEVSVVSVYFRDLADGPILGINENEEFIAASLLKVPTAITFFKLAEEEESDILQKRLHFQGEIRDEKALEQYFKPAQTIRPGTSYTIEELIFNSLVYSDNLSNEVLKSSIQSMRGNLNLIVQTYKELGLIATANINTPDISTRGYATIFRMLYNASYLSLKNSEKILSILAQSTFDEGIVSGIPKDIKVANKFGERFIGDEKQLHDCGIVYFPKNAYLLCVMTRGKEFAALTGIIGEISKMVYEEVESRKITY